MPYTTGVATGVERYPQPLEQDVTCLGCGYNLRSLDVQGQCPECGWLIARSIHGDLLRYADQQWLRRVHIGLSMIHCGLWFLVLAFFAGVIIMVVVSVGPSNLPDSLLGRIVQLAMRITGYTMLVGLPLAYMVGWWLATSPDPAESQSRSLHRAVLRVTGVLLLPVFVLWMKPDALAIQATWSPMGIEIIALLCFAVVWTHLYVLWSFMAHINRRCTTDNAKLNDKRRRRMLRLRREIIGVPLFVLGLHAFAVATTIAGGFPNAARTGNFGWGTGIGYLLMGLLWIVVTANVSTILKGIRNERAARAKMPIEQRAD